jgi:phasin family protein
MASKPTKKSPAKSAKSATSASSVVPFAQLGNSASTKPFESMEKIMSTSKNQYEKITADASVASRQGVEAFIKSSTTFAKGAEQMFKTIAALVQSSTERNSAAMKDLMACKTLNELTEAQNRIAQENFEEMMTASTKLSEMAIKLTTEAFEPINDQVGKSIKKASQSMAA